MLTIHAYLVPSVPNSMADYIIGIIEMWKMIGKNLISIFNVPINSADEFALLNEAVSL